MRAAFTFFVIGLALIIVVSWLVSWAVFKLQRVAVIEEAERIIE